MTGLILRKIVGKAVPLLVVFFFLTAPLSAQKWPDVTAEETALKDCPGQPGAAAVCLYREEVEDFDRGETRIFRRIKILTAAGRDWANIEIPFPKGYYKIKGLEARVVPPDGAPVPFTGEVFEKTALRGRGLRVAVKTFALPDIEPGAIIDYRYKLVPETTGGPSADIEDILDALGIRPGKPKEGDIGKGMKLISFPGPSWDVQEELFTLRAKFIYVQPEIMGLVLSLLFNEPGSLMWYSRGLSDCRPTIDGKRIEFSLQNIPAFEAEELMAPEETEKMGLNIFFIRTEFKERGAYWELECGSWQKAAKTFLGNMRKLAETSLAIIGDETDPIARLRKLYERAQQIRNLSYEKHLTSKQRKQQKIKDNHKAADVLERDYGYRSDITRTFVALAQAAGFEAEVVRVSTRDDKLFREAYLSFTDQLDSEMALVKVGERDLLFDPATPFCPFGLIHWSRTDAAAVRFSEKAASFFRTSSYVPNMALTQREIVLELDPQGSLAGTVKTTYTGHEALVRRLDHMHDDQEDIRKSMEEELAGLLPMGAGVTMTGLEDIDTNKPAFVVRYEVTIPGIVTSAGDRMLLPASPLLGTGQYPFRHDKRKFAVYFPYPFREFNDIVITLPEGTIVETRPEARKSQNDFSVYSLACAIEGPRRVHVQRDLQILKSYFPATQYRVLKAFYDKVRTNDEERIVLGKEKK
jgi:hypothetical protein